MRSLKRVSGATVIALLAYASATFAFNSAPSKKLRTRTLDHPDPTQTFDRFYVIPEPNIVATSFGIRSSGVAWELYDRFDRAWFNSEVASPDFGPYQVVPLRYANRRPFFLMLCDGPDPATANCRYPLTSEDPDNVDIGWVNVRKSWDDADFNEHGRLFAATMDLAGLPSVLKNPFWVVYGGQNTYLETQLKPATDNNAALYIVGASWSPVDPDSAESLVVRPVSVPELAQLPDSANSVADWVHGDESCPLDQPTSQGSITDPFPVEQRIRRCHDFASMMGAVNANHFGPLNRSYWDYYHTLALRQAKQCMDLADGIGAQLERQGALHVDSPRQVDHSALNTEIHECERVTLIWEAVAQHYLEDTWSTGHMFRRWGYTNPYQFPDQLSLDTPQLLASLSPTDRMARKLYIANAVAMYSGSIHGAKAVLAEIFQANPKRIFDDPLSSPTYSVDSLLLPVQWRDQDSINGPFQGAGDLFLDDILAGAVPSAPNTSGWGLQEQRHRLLGCAVSSVREVYQNLPQWSGSLGAIDQTVGDPIDPHTDRCWLHWATNASMAASQSVTFQMDLGTNNLFYVPLSATIPAWTFNSIILRQVASTIPYFGPDATATDEGTSLTNKIAADLTADTTAVGLLYEQNRKANAIGTESAQQQKVSVLGVSPNDSPNSSTVSGAALVYYADQFDEAMTPGNTFDSAIQDMFPRAFARHTCEQGPSASALASRCVAFNAGGEGDPTACTLCRTIVRNWVQDCPSTEGDPNELVSFGPSPCDALGITPQLRPAALGSPGPVLRRMVDCPSSLTRDIVADKYCSGDVGERMSSDVATTYWLNQVRSHEVAGYDIVVPVKERELVDTTPPGQARSTYLSIKTDFDERISSEDAALTSFGGLQYWESSDYIYERNHRGFEALARACGATQRAVVKRDTCAQLYARLGLPLPVGFQPYELFDTRGPEVVEQLLGPDLGALVSGEVQDPNFCLSYLPVTPLAIGCTDELNCRTDGFCSAQRATITPLD